MYRGDRASPSLSLIDRFQSRTGKSVRLDLIATAAMDVRLLSLFMFYRGNSSCADSACPDLVEVPIQSIGKYFRPSVADVGFLPLNGYLEKSGWKNRIVASRFSAWSKAGAIFGVPHDLHPCTLTYRKDLFDQAGVDLVSVKTWPEFQRRCLLFQLYWRSQGRPRSAMALSSSGVDMLLVMLHQQHVELVDDDLSLHLTDPKVASTICWYAQAVAGPNRIGTDPNPAAGQSAADLSTGDICARITPDWLVADLKRYGPDMAGKLRLLPLPKFNESDAPTASWGGTMIGITRSCRDPDSAWKLIQSLYLDPAAIQVQKKVSGILPPIPEYWPLPIFHQPDPFFGGQKIDELYIAMAGELPELKMTPYTTAAQAFLTLVLNESVEQVRTSGEHGLETSCQRRLEKAQADLREMIAFGKSG
jgi:arabinosaccharide transport system substrate-binding protein